MRYIAVITKFTDNCYTISYPDFPESDGKFSHLGGAIIHARYMLQEIVNDAMMSGNPLPEPTPMKYIRGDNAFYIEVNNELHSTHS